jgi:hypothetical protein
MTPQKDRHGVGEEFSTANALTYVRERDESPSASVIEAVSEATGTEPDRMQVLYEVIDPDALDALFEPDADGKREPPSGHVSFRFAGCSVTVYANRRTVVSPLATDRR